MAVDALHSPQPGPGTGHEHEHAEGVYHQFEDIDQQNESYVVGMWAFLVTEVMFFAPLFFSYALYRWVYQKEFYIVHKKLDWVLGGVNTSVLLFSSFLVAMAVHFAQKKNVKAQLTCLAGTIGCAFGFLIIKTMEWVPKFQEHLYPGPNFSWPPVPHHGADTAKYAEFAEVPSRAAEMFFSLYFATTGLHGIHVLIGILVIGALMFLTWRKSKLVESYVTTEMVGLYWHFVDLVWIFLFPLYYLMPK